MEIIRKGTKITDPLKNKTKKKKCYKCGCKFKFNSEDLYISDSLIGMRNYYVDCPQCGTSFFIRETY